MKYRYGLITAAILTSIMGCGLTAKERIVLSHLQEDTRTSATQSEKEKALDVIDRILLAHGGELTDEKYEGLEKPYYRFYQNLTSRKGIGTQCQIIYYKKKLDITIYELYATTDTLSDDGKAIAMDIYNALSEAFSEKKDYILHHYKNKQNP